MSNRLNKILVHNMNFKNEEINTEIFNYEDV